MSTFSGTLPDLESSIESSSHERQLERVPVLIFDQPSQIAYHVARRIANLIQEYRLAGRTLVLGLPTGSTPIGVYQQLIRMHREEGLDFSNVVTFNLDEYHPMDPNSLQSYHRFMRENFFDHVNIPEENIHIPQGNIPTDQVENYCLSYEHAIRKAGGIDLILLGIGRSGHIGFNEPGSGRDTRTRLITLDEITRKDAASDFFEEKNVPREAITMGVGTILEAREIILIATGEHKANIIRKAVEEEPNHYVTASFLQLHRNASLYVDRAAASELTREKTPWLVRKVDWADKHMAKRAVIWLSELTGKAILRLEESDFNRHHLYDLVHSYPHVDDLCRDVFEDLRKRIFYRDQLIKNQKVIVFSPHPDDDVISMGGMLDKLASNGNDVIVAYMTNGALAVFDADVRRVIRFDNMSAGVLGHPETEEARLQKEKILRFLREKGPGDVDIEEVQKIKAYIRYAEAVSGIEVMRLSEENARFLDLPFYRTGRVKKDPIGNADIEVILDLLNEFHPDHVFVAGDLSDPHGTHRMCYEAIKEALKRYAPQCAPLNAPSPDPSLPVQPLVWLYRGAWHEWEIDKADVFLPLSKADLDRKIEAIFKHESQKDRAMFPGAYDEREFWQRARDRNIGTAETLSRLGLPTFTAAEAFVTTYIMP